jgi:hypothetical protein
MADELELEAAEQREDDPEHAALMSLADEVEAGTASSEELQDLVCEVEEKTGFAKFIEDLQTRGLIPAIVALFVPDESTPSTKEDAPEDIDAVNSERYVLTDEELQNYNPAEIESLQVIAQAGIPPANIDQLYQEECSSGTTREQFFEYTATAILACSVFEVAPDRMLPLILATMKMESNFSPRAYNDGSGATGLMQHMPQYWDSRAGRLVDAGIYSNPPDIWDTQAQIFASVNLYLTDLRKITSAPSTYDPDKFGRDAYLTYNCGGGHAWLAKIGALDWTNEDLQELYNMPEAERVALYGEEAATFRDYAIRRLTRARGERSFDRVQASYTQYRNILYGNS